jgi:hypothetical protein
LTKLTTATAITFMVTSLILTRYGTGRAPISDLIQQLPAPSGQTETVPPPNAADQAPADVPPANEPAPTE